MAEVQGVQSVPYFCWSRFRSRPMLGQEITMHPTRFFHSIAAIVVGWRQGIQSGLVLAALVLAAVPAAAGVSCPENTIWYVCDDTLRATSTAPAWNFDSNEPWIDGVG